ncbi:MAG: MaoC family dehydratase [Pyrinomonadaceae bacterium]
MTIAIKNIAELKNLVGREVAVSDWLEVSQARINQFAEATGDNQWIHIDAERAKAESPFGQTIAHGFLTVSLLSKMSQSAMRVGGVTMAINYGLNRVRFIAPVLSDSKIRARFALGEIKDFSGGFKAIWNTTIESETGEKPCCIAEWLVRYYI